MLVDLIDASQVRQLMGHAQFGARVVFGDCIFFTISPNEQHSALVMRLSRYRQSDPYLQGSHDNAELLRRLAAETKPELEMELPFPDYEVRRIASARDPLAVVEAFMVHVRQRLPVALGMRMCPICPRCNDTDHPCQDKFGSNMTPLGGIFGACSAMGAAIEHQANVFYSILTTIKFFL